MQRETDYGKEYKYTSKWTGDNIYCANEPVLYKGYYIFNNQEYFSGISCPKFDIVKNNICIGQYAGINGAKIFIDTLTVIV